MYTIYKLYNWEYSKTGLKRPLKKRSKIDIQDQISLNVGQKYCRMLQDSILQNILPSFSYHLSLKPLFCLILSCRLRQVLLYGMVYLSSVSRHLIPSTF